MINSYAVRHKDSKIREKSRSGGFFTALSDYVLEHKGTVYGCIMNSKLQIVHAKATSKDERDLMCGSKYVQSHVGTIFKSVLEDLDNGSIVLFSGTSCQIDGLLHFLKGKKNTANLITVDVLCHGVPSRKVWEEYILWNEKKKKSLITGFDFRNKKDFGWRAHVEKIVFENGRKIDSEVYRNLFMSDLALRPSCYACRYKSITHPADFTIADYWGIEKVAPQFDDNKGVSLVLANNKKAQHIFEMIKDSLYVKETNIDNSLQPALQAPTQCPTNREEFWKDFLEKGFDFVVKKYGFKNWKKDFIRTLKKDMNVVFKRGN